MGQIGANGGKQKPQRKSRRRYGASPVGQLGANGDKILQAKVTKQGKSRRTKRASPVGQIEPSSVWSSVGICYRVVVFNHDHGSIVEEGPNPGIWEVFRPGEIIASAQVLLLFTCENNACRVYYICVYFQVQDILFAFIGRKLVCGLSLFRARFMSHTQC